MRYVPCISADASGLKFSTSVGLPASPWIVRVPPPLTPLLEDALFAEPLQATRPVATTAATTARSNGEPVCERRLTVHSCHLSPQAAGRQTGECERLPASAGSNRDGRRRFQ